MWTDCNKKLEESLQMALQYQDTMQVCVQKWLHKPHLSTVLHVFMPSCEQVQHNPNVVYLQGLFEWLKSAELRSTEEFMVGTDLESVKGQLCDLKVSFCLHSSAIMSDRTDDGVIERITSFFGLIIGIYHNKT